MSTETKVETLERIIFLPGWRLDLRLLTKEDAKPFVRWLNDGEVTQYLSRHMPITLLQEEKYLEELYKDDKNFVFGIETKDGKLIGSMGLHQIDYVSGTATTGAFIGDKNLRNKGYGTEAKMLLLDYAFNTRNLRKICSRVFAFNPISINYSKKCGYHEEGRLKKHHFRNGEYYDEVMLAVFREDWLPLWEEYKSKAK